jgi:hypothetical protein
LCFCSSCRTEAQRDNVDVDRLQRTVQSVIQRVFNSAESETHEPELDEAWLMSLPEFDGFARTRQRIVTSLVAAMRASATTPLTYLDPSGATLGYATGRPSTPKPATSIAWRDGIDLRSIAQTVDTIGVLAYFADEARLHTEMQSYQSLGVPLEVILRPMAPDIHSSRDLIARVKSLRQQNVADVSFYHYGFMRLESLTWIQHALR